MFNRFKELEVEAAVPWLKLLTILLPHGGGTLAGQSHLNVNELNLRPWGQSPLFTSNWLLQL